MGAEAEEMEDPYVPGFSGEMPAANQYAVNAATENKRWTLQTLIILFRSFLNLKPGSSCASLRLVDPFQTALLTTCRPCSSIRWYAAANYALLPPASAARPDAAHRRGAFKPAGPPPPTGAPPLLVRPPAHRSLCLGSRRGQVWPRQPRGLGRLASAG